MDNQEHGKDHTSGHDGHGVHICHKCGWPFPNPHPSARHRRAHKKICGRIDGYKLVDTQGFAHSDDEHVSDEDHKTPSPQILDRSNDEKKCAGSFGRSRSEDEAFVDAVTEFSDSGSGKVIEDSSDDVKKPARSIESILENDTKTALSFEDDAITATIPPSSTSADSSQDSEIQGNILSEDALESESQPSHVEIRSVGRPVTDCRTEECGHESIDEKQSSICNLNPIPLETRADVSQENLKKRAREDVAVTDVMGNEDHNKKRNAVDGLIEVDTKENEKTHLDRLLLDVETTSHNAIQTSDTVCTLGKTEDVTSDHVAAAGVVESKEQCGGDLDSRKSLNPSSSEVDSIEHANTYFSSTQINVSATGDMASAGSGKLTEIANEEGEVNENFLVFSVPDDRPVLKNPEMTIEGYKDHKAGSTLQLVDVDSFEVINSAKDSHKINPSNSFSSLSDEGKELFASGTSVSEDNIRQEGENSEHVKDSVHKVNPSNSFSSLSDEGEQLFASDRHVSRDNIQPEGENRENVVEKFLDETELGGPPHKEAVSEGQITEEAYGLKDAAVDEIEKSSTVQCPQEHLSDDYHYNLSKSISSEHGTCSKSDTTPVAALVDAEVRQVINVVDTGATADYEISRFNITKGEEVEGIAEDSYGKVMLTPIDVDILLEGKVHERNDFSEGKNSSDNGKDKVESNYGAKIEFREGDSLLGSVDESTLMNTTMTPEIAKDLHETLVTSKTVVNASEINLSEPECAMLNKASDNQERVMECGTNDKAKVLVDDCTAVESDNAGDNDESRKLFNNAGDVEILQSPSDKIDDFEVLQNSLREYLPQESQFSASNASSSTQNSATLGNNPARELVEAAPENQSESCPDEGENKLVAQQLGASATDFSVDSGSLSDSLEGHWGSVSVLSTQSDMQAIVDMEPLAYGSKASAEAEKEDKEDVKEKKTSTEGAQQTDKSDIFEPPSFMTLVEPRDGDKAAAADEIQRAQNLQQPKDAQAGWFPSLTKVVNESQGRKKNEEIIAKVTNWSTSKQHSPLKNLLSEANTENKPKLLSPKENQPPVVQKDEPKPTVISARDKSASDTTEKPVAGPQITLPEPVKKDDTGKEWNSPARYPADIKREKRKVKGRPYWAQFMCCSSVN